MRGSFCAAKFGIPTRIVTILGLPSHPHLLKGIAKSSLVIASALGLLLLGLGIKLPQLAVIFMDRSAEIFWAVLTVRAAGHFVTSEL